MALATPAQAQFFWDQSNTASARMERKRIRHARQRTPKKVETARETTKPVGPVIIAISIEKQQLKLHDVNGVFAESPVSTGTASHPTPMGVFSIIGKEVFHRSNIYSGAPMPHMQRITWSGVAMHAGVLPGYPASHGCIRLPASFATRLFGWTKMGARVVITPGELSPQDFSHPLLVTTKPQGVDPNMPVVAANSPSSELRLTSATGTGDAPRKGDEIRTADASGAVPASMVTASDAKPDVKAELKLGTDAKPSDPKTDSAAPAAAALPQPGSPEFIGPIRVRTGQIAAYVSRKTGRLYVRQNFDPLFDVPVTIAATDRPLGTHVFTVRADKDNENNLQWSVVSLPAPPPRAARRADSARGKTAPPVAQPAPQPPLSAAEALDKITIPEDAMKRIALALAPGGSLTISDHGLGDETGKGTDFIVPLRDPAGTR